MRGPSARLRPGAIGLAACLIFVGCAPAEDPVAGLAPVDSARVEIVDHEGRPLDAEGAPTEAEGADATGAAADGDGADRSVADPLGSERGYSVVAQATADNVVVRAEPDAGASPVAALVHPTASGAPLVFRAVDGGVSSAEWINVHLPIEPNGSTGWVRRDDVALSNNPYSVEIDRASYSLRVYELEELLVDTTIAVGAGATPTPVGEFYLLELLRPSDPDGAYGPFAFGLSGFSEVLSEFGGADTAIIGIHGTNDPSSLGTEVSHGCVRLENPIIEELARTLPLGTPVRIT